jgi:hypothetical protein
MDISSVRSLKAEVAEHIVKPLLGEVRVGSSFGVSARRMTTVTGTEAGIALGITKGTHKSDYRLAVRLQRRFLEGIPDLHQRFEQQAKGEVDVQYVGRLQKRQLPWHQMRQRPLLLGCSVGHHKITAGTLGAFVLHKQTQRTVILSNNHVLADEDRGKVGDAILQPGAYDKGNARAHKVGTLLNFVKLKSSANLTDAAIATLGEKIPYDGSTLTGLGKLAGLRPSPIEPGTTVMKVGRTSGLTRGRVTAIEVDNVVVGFDKGELSFDSQIEIEGADEEPFSRPGDSGSLIVDEDRRACGLLFAGGDVGGSNGKGLTYANDLATVLRQLKITLAD